jgi:hypothetical protein
VDVAGVCRYLGRKVGEENDVVIGDGAVVLMRAREERQHQILLVCLQLGRELGERARLLERLDAQLALPHRPQMLALVPEALLDGREHRRHELHLRLLHVDELNHEVLGAVVAYPRHLAVFSIAH